MFIGKTKIGLSLIRIIGLICSSSTIAATTQLPYDVELNTNWIDTYVNESSILRYVIRYFNKGTETANNVNINMNLPTYLRYIRSNHEGISNAITGMAYDEDVDPCMIDLRNETGLYISILDTFAQDNGMPNLYSLLLVDPDNQEIFNSAPYNGSQNMVGDYIIQMILRPDFNIREFLYNISGVDVQQDYPQCGSEVIVEQSRNIGSLSSGIGGQITVYLQILEDGLYSIFNDNGTITANQTINYGLSEESIDNGPIYNTYTNNSNQGVTTVFLTKAGVPELFSNEDMLNSLIQPGMTEQEKAVALRQFVKDYTLNYPNPNSQQRYAGTLRPSLADYSDPVRALNTVYGMCGEINSAFLSLARMAGLTGRTIGLSGHIPAEVLIDGNWAYMDADGGAYWTDPNDGHIYSLSELEADPSIITNDPQDLNYEPNYYADLIASSGDNTILGEYILTPAAPYTMALQLYPHDIINYGTYNLNQTPSKYYGEGTIKRTLNPDYAITDITADSFTFHESLPYLIINTYIDSDGNIPDDLSVELIVGTGASEQERAVLGHLHERLGFEINRPTRSDNYYDYKLRFQCQSACNIEEIIPRISVTSSFTYNSLVLPHYGSVDLNILAADTNFAGIDVQTEYNTNDQISLTTTLSTDQDNILLNNDRTLKLNALDGEQIILPATGAYLQNVLLNRGYTNNDPDILFEEPGWFINDGASIDFYNTFTFGENIILASDDKEVQALLPQNVTAYFDSGCNESNFFAISGYIGTLDVEDAIQMFPNLERDNVVKLFDIATSCNNSPLLFSEPIRIRIYIDEVIGDTDTIKAEVSNDGITLEEIPATKIDDHTIEVVTPHFSQFKISLSTNNSNPSGGGGGGGSSTPKDNCPTGDFSSSYYDGTCGTPTTPTTTQNTGTITVTGATNTCNVSNELVLAYDLAFDLGITSATDVCQADMYGPVLRKYLAKFLTVYGTKVLGMRPDTTRTCTFNDVNNESTEMQFYMKIACQLGLMGLKQDGTPASIFNPNELVNRAQFGTVFSRLIFGPKYNIPMSDSRPRYQNHLNILKRTTIMDKIDEPYMVELRGYVMLMMMKAKTLLRK